MINEPNIYMNRGDNTTCTVSLNGYVLSWQINNQEVIFVSRAAVFDGLRSSHGGISFAFPVQSFWPQAYYNGFTRLNKWKLVDGPRRDPFGDIITTICLEENRKTRSMWCYEFRLSLTISLRERELDFDIMIENTDQYLSFPFTFVALSYVKVPDVTKCEVIGLKDCKYFSSDNNIKVYKEQNNNVSLTDYTRRFYRNVPDTIVITNIAGGKHLKIEKTNLPDVLLWTPWVNFQNEPLSNIMDDEWDKFICVQPGHAIKSIVLKPGEFVKTSYNLILMDTPTGDHDRIKPFPDPLDPHKLPHPPCEFYILQF